MGKSILACQQIYKMKFPQAQLDWYHPLHHQGELQIAPAIKVCLNAIK
jgi:hypothetical protein